MNARYLRIRLHYLLGIILLCIVAGLLALLSLRFQKTIDITDNNRYTLSPISQALLDQFTQPLAIRIYARDDQTVREPIANIFTRYQRYKPNIQLTFIDPYTAPLEVEKKGITMTEEILLEYAGQSVHLQQSPELLSEQVISDALQTLLRPHKRQLRFLTWHGERSPVNNANHDLSHWATQLNNKGFIVDTLQFDKTPKIPEETDVFIIASPQVSLLPDEVDKIIEFIEMGGNLLWLLEPEGVFGLEPLMEKLGIIIQPGLIIDPESQVPTMATATPYKQHPIIDNFPFRCLFPKASGLIVSPPDEWQTDDLLLTVDNAWLERGDISQLIQYDKGTDIPGPLTIAVALNRALKAKANNAQTSPVKRTQRIVVIGDGDFLSNAFLDNGGNAEFGTRVINWLSQDDSLIQIPTQVRQDLTLDLSQYEAIFLGVLFLIIFPISFFSMALIVWLRRRKT
ncbi:ABC-type uncharacterized transport system involved in gliding motility, auxiliary component [Beggiatoa alba B18LD]|uniref:ABC-type uncharacterized transport system involved in gliding motility, auxiliary component n=1 Tax=Beggiatoa alba B18LD TaxID=395493 RepID=I3CKV2_9GAMM|nr:GldG family protein [Beggiatoa alba]EIJ44245.1 ABC-type uncharacterized transport system involved in gliding motility, auxiliary component [Beggiatoa alba B18LD]